VHFPARQARYGRIRPHRDSHESVAAVWSDLAIAAGQGDIELNAWVIRLFQDSEQLRPQRSPSCRQRLRP
jgi:hypothetical protein